MNRYQQSGNAVGSDIAITLLTSKNQADLIFKELWVMIHGFEKRFSRFIVDSELSKFNRNAGSFVDISQQFSEVLKACIDQANRTDGLFNPFQLPALQKSGYKGSWPNVNYIAKNIDFSEKKSNITINDLVLQNNKAKIPKNSAIDLGGIGKGYLLDELSAFLDNKGIENYWISLGGDIICNGQDIDSRNWIVGVNDALDNRGIISQIENKKSKKFAIATSGTTKRKGKNWHHIIDPQTSKPAITDILTATVVGGSAIEADINAKAIVIVGSKKCAQYIKTKQVIGALVQISDNGNSKIMKYGEIK